jgi:hypothetical protein
MSDTPPPVFIIGNPRSGTTLLRLMLTNHQNIVIPPECGFAVWFYEKYHSLHFSENEISAFIQDLSGARKIETWNLDYAQLRKYIISSEVASYPQIVAAVYKFYGHSLGKNARRWGDKNNFYLHHIETLSTMFPSAQFIHIVRDGRDVACSYKALSKSQIISRYAPDLPVSIQEIAHEWMENIQKIRTSFKKLPSWQVLEIRYEDLVSSTVKELQKICDFLGEPYDPAMELYYLKNKQEQQEPVEFLQWKVKTLEKPTTTEIGKYKRELSGLEIKEFEAIAKQILGMYHYEIES